MVYGIQKIMYPEIFQGKRKKKNYFEGWYYKAIDQYSKKAIVVIPGIAYGKMPWDSHAFIQVFDEDHRVYYIEYDLSQFTFNENIFEIKIGENYFSRYQMRLNIDHPDLRMKGKLQFHGIVEYPKTLLSPGIMGPFSYIPWMQCYHGVVNIHHEIFGKLLIDDRTVDFTGGYGYIEKDWGRSFPDAWIWFQSNHFQQEGISLMCSVARIPVFGFSFMGFLSFLKIKDNIYTFATYTGARIRKVNYHKKQLSIVIEDRKYRMELKVQDAEGGVLKAPENGQMKRTIIESIHGTVEVCLLDQKGMVLFQGKGWNTGIEIVKKIFDYL